MIAGDVDDCYVDDRGRERRVPAATLAALEDVYGSEHVELAMPLTNLGVMYLATGQLEQAATAQERAIALFRTGYGVHYPHTALATLRLGVVRAAQGRTAVAADLLRRALANTEAAFDPGHADIAAIRADLARVTDSTA